MKKYYVYYGFEAVSYGFATTFMVLWIILDLAHGNVLSWWLCWFLISLLLSQVFYNLRQHAK